MKTSLNDYSLKKKKCFPKMPHSVFNLLCFTLSKCVKYKHAACKIYALIESKLFQSCFSLRIRCGLEIVWKTSDETAVDCEIAYATHI